MNGFKRLGLSDATIRVLEKKGFNDPSPIQEKTLPVLLDGEHDIVGRAQTGTGKTACFALPILENIKKSDDVQALILAPTRELAVQVATEIRSLKGERNVRVTTIYGGASIRTQMDELKRGVDIVVGTPGRVIDLINRKRLDIRNISYAVLDEADEMLNMGFVEDIEEILSQTPHDKKMLMFSATMPKEILRIAGRFMREYELIEIDQNSLATDLIEQVYYDILGKDRYSAIRRIIVTIPDFYGIIFCKTKVDVDKLSHKLVGDNYAAAALHGDISQAQRENILKQFKDKRINILIATDVAARGIDVNDLTVVINYSLPQTPELYIHRIGRTGRMGNKGMAITFLIPSERRKLKPIERLINQKIQKGELPTIQSAIDSKKEQIGSVISEMLKSRKQTEYDDVAQRLLNGNNPGKVVSAVLRYAFANELDLESYRDIEQVSADGSFSGSGDRNRRKRGGRKSRQKDRRGFAERVGDSSKRKSSKRKGNSSQNGGYPKKESNSSGKRKKFKSGRKRKFRKRE